MSSKRQVNFQDAMRILSDMQDQKFLQYAKEFTQTLTILTAKLEVVENLAKEKFGITQEELEEAFFNQMDKLNGIPKNEGAIATSGDRVRIKFAQALSQEELATAASENTIIILGKNQVHANLDTALTGLKAGEKFSVILPSPEAGGKDVFVQGDVRAVYSIPKDEVESKQAQSN